jgi:hypothetical protein
VRVPVDISQTALLSPRSPAGVVREFNRVARYPLTAKTHGSLILQENRPRKRISIAEITLLSSGESGLPSGLVKPERTVGKEA